MDIRHLRKSCYRRVGLWRKRNRVDVGVSSFVQLYAGVMRMRKQFTRTNKRELPVAGIRNTGLSFFSVLKTLFSGILR